MGTARFFDGLTAHAHDVSVEIEGGFARIRSGNGAAYDWPLRDMAAQVAPDGVVTLRCGQLPARLVVDDPGLRAELRQHVRRWPQRQAGWRAVALMASALAGLGLFTVAALPTLLTPLVPLAWEQSLGGNAQSLLMAKHHRCTGVEGQRALDHFVQNVAGAGGIAAPVTLTVIDDKLVNAFALPGNRVLLMRGLIATSGDGDEVAGVLAHELGHVAHRDSTRQLVRQAGLSAIAAALGWSGFNTGGLAETLVSLSYSRSVEAAADAFAVDTLQQAGIRSDGLARFFDRIEKDALPGFLSDHPPTAERGEWARRPVIGEPAFTAPEWAAIRAMCDGSNGPVRLF